MRPFGACWKDRRRAGSSTRRHLPESSHYGWSLLSEVRAPVLRWPVGCLIFRAGCAGDFGMTYVCRVVVSSTPERGQASQEGDLLWGVGDWEIEVVAC